MAKGKGGSRRSMGSTQRMMSGRGPMMPSGGVQTTGNFQGKSNSLGMGGRAAQLKAKGVPGGVIGNLARKAGAAPGGPNFHGGKKKGKKK